mmetsp:Transcript_16856/g.20241  ORF Transcript_16856/g.20241 Transcript_16856/m.20241 type:complete len:101 (+) Transcript_16856:368-670(+)
MNEEFWKGTTEVCTIMMLLIDLDEDGDSNENKEHEEFLERGNMRNRMSSRTSWLGVCRGPALGIQLKHKSNNASIEFAKILICWHCPVRKIMERYISHIF